MNDADSEMAELTRIGNMASKLAKKGICLHGWRKAPFLGSPFDNSDGMATCLHCGKVATWKTLDDERNDYL